jgi:hypothetical protein
MLNNSTVKNACTICSITNWVYLHFLFVRSGSFAVNLKQTLPHLLPISAPLVSNSLHGSFRRVMTQNSVTDERAAN